MQRRRPRLDDIAVVATYEPGQVMGFSHRVASERIIEALKDSGVRLRLYSFLDRDIPEKNVLFVGTFTQNVLGAMSRFMNRRRVVGYFTVEGIPMIPPHAAERKVAKRVKIAACSAFVKTMIESASIPQYDEIFQVAKVVPHGLDMKDTGCDEDYAKWLKDWIGDNAVVLSVQSMTQGVDRKGMMNFLAAAACVKSVRVGVKFILHSGGGEMDPRQISRLLGLERSFWFTNSFGLYTGGQMNSLYRAADVYACTSLVEGFGMTNLEAFRHNVPVVAIDAQPFSEYITNGKTGLLTPVLDVAQVPWMDQIMMLLHRYDVSEYARRLLELLDPKRNMDMRENIREAKMTLDVRRTYPGLLQLFE